MLHPLLEAVFQALDKAGVTWCLLRIPSNPSAPSGDVDLLVSRADTGRLQRVLESLGVVRMPTSAPATQAFFLTYHPCTDRWIILHVVTELSYGPHFVLRTRTGQGCLARRQRSDAMTLLAPDDAFWALLLHCLVDKGTVALHYRSRLQELAGAAQAEGPLARVVRDVCPVGWTPARLIGYVQRGEWSALEACARSLSRAWMWREGAWVRLVGRRVRQLLHKPLLLRRRRGVRIALLGANGVGKSTLASGLQRTFGVPVHTVHMGLRRREAQGMIRPGIDVARRPFLAAWRYLQAQYQQALGRLVIFDCDTYDALPPRPPYVWLKAPYLWLIAHACPAPDVVLVLDAPGEVIYARKAEQSLEETQDERQRFVALAQRLPQLQIVDANRAGDAVRVDVTDRIWQQYVVRWRSTAGPAQQADSPGTARGGDS